MCESPEINEVLFIERLIEIRKGPRMLRSDFGRQSSRSVEGRRPSRIMKKAIVMMMRGSDGAQNAPYGVGKHGLVRLPFAR